MTKTGYALLCDAEMRALGWYPTANLRWYRAPGASDADRVLQCQWTHDDVIARQWRDVEIVRAD